MQVWCHCADCRKWYQNSPVAIAIFPEEAFLELEGGESISKFQIRNPEMDRTFCKARLYSSLASSLSSPLAFPSHLAQQIGVLSDAQLTGCMSAVFVAAVLHGQLLRSCKALSAVCVVWTESSLSNKLKKARRAVEL